jgi:glycosyltransferase involved in cell wall biosynthesis
MEIMKKILVIGAFPPPTGGMETVMEQMFSIRLKDYSLISMDVAKDKLTRSNIIFNLMNFFYRCFKLIMLILIKKPEIVHIHVSSYMGFWQKAIYHKIAKLFGKKTILHMHGADFKEFYEKNSKKTKSGITAILDSADGIIALSSDWNFFYSSISNNKNIFIIENAIENINKKAFKRIYPISSFIVLFVGRICKRKGAYDLLAAISRIDNPMMKFVFVGPYEDKEKFISELKRLKIENRCELIGEIIGKDRFTYFASGDAFVLPSYAEGLPVAILEAMYFGLPIISTTVGAIPEVIKKENGILIHPGDIAGLHRSIVQIYNDHDLRDQMNKKNVQLINKRYTLTHFKIKLEKTYNNML